MTHSTPVFALCTIFFHVDICSDEKKFLTVFQSNLYGN